MSSKTVSITLEGEDWAIPVSYRVAADLCDAGIDPLRMAMAAQSTGTLPITFEQLITVIYIGTKRAGCKLTKDDIGEAIVAEIGMVAALEVASQILTLIVTGGPNAEESNVSGKKQNAGRRKIGGA